MFSCFLLWKAFTVSASKIKSDFQISFFQGYSETNAILFPCENAGVSWHIFMARWRKFALNLCSDFSVSLEMSLGHHLCLALSVSSYQQFRWHNPKQCLVLSVPCELVALDAICAPCIWLWERLLGSMGCIWIQSSQSSHACLTSTMSIYAQMLCWGGMEEKDGKK